MQVVDFTVLEPGACFITNRNDGPFIDTLLDIDDQPLHGRVYIAVSALSDMAGMVGFLNPEDSQRLKDGIVERDQRIAELEQALEGLTRANEALVVAGYNPTAFAPLEDLVTPGDGLEELGDDDLLQRVVSAELDLPPDATRDDMIVALREVPV